MKATPLPRALALPLGLLLAALALRGFGFLVAVIDTDEGLYMVQAQAWLRGQWPLVAVWDMHPIGAPAVFALGMGVLGDSIFAIRLLGCVCIALAGWALHGLVRVAGAPRPIALAAALIYIGHSLRLGGLAVNTEVLFAPLVVTAMALGLRGLVRALRAGLAPGWWSLVGMGLAIGMALTIKPVVVPEGCLAFALLVFPALWRRLMPLRRGFTMAAAYTALCLLPTLGFALAYAVQGHFQDFLDGSFLAPFRYAAERLSPDEALHRVLVAFLFLLWPFALAALALWRWVGRRGPGALLAWVGLVWFLVGSLGVAMPGFYYPHYFLIWLPALSVLAALGGWAAARLLPSRRRALGYALLVAVTVIGSWRADTTARVDRGIGLFSPDPVRQLAAKIMEELKPGETIYVVNYHPVLYALTRVVPPTRFVFPAHLTGDFTEVAGIDTDQEVARILASRPRFVVVDRGWWPLLRESAAEIITQSLASDFVYAGEVAEERGPIELWQPR